PRTFKSLSGTHTFLRNQHYCEGCKETFYPRDEELGLPKHGDVSLELERRIVDWVLLLPAAGAEVHWNFHNPLCPLTANQFRQTALRLGKMAEGADAHVWVCSTPPDSAPQGIALHTWVGGITLALGAAFCGAAGMGPGDSTLGACAAATVGFRIGRRLETLLNKLNSLGA
ncbi:MAG: hypothetical protein ACKVPX_09395, partial [Myxococcaceae bacterium]